MSDRQQEPYKLGTYQLGYRWVDVYLVPNSPSANFHWLPSDKGNGRINVGFDYYDEDSVWALLFHEALEFIITDQGCRIRSSNLFMRDSSDCVKFAFDHNQFTEIAAKMACFVRDIKEDFQVACEIFLKK